MADVWAQTRTLAKEGRFDEIDDAIYIRYKHNIQGIHQDALQSTPLPPLPHTTGIWYYGPSGAGKSRQARADYPDAYQKAANKWWDGYTGQDAVIIDDFDPGHNVLGHHLKIWADHYAFTAEKKGGALYIRPDVICITSQYLIEEIWTDPATIEALKRRFKVTTFLPPLM